MSPPRPIGQRPASGSGSGNGLSPESVGVTSLRSREGRTPPPAPSAAYARRAREIIEDEVGVPVPVPIFKPNLGDDDDDGDDDTEPAHSIAAGYRRARAGTLPSSLPAQRIVPDELPSSTPLNNARTSALSPAYPNSAPNPSRPALRHTASSAANLETPTTATRVRSGSLTSLQRPLGNGYGASLFAPAPASNPSRSPLGQAAARAEDEMDFTSPSGSNGTLAADDLQFSTLDYLGLAEGGDAQLPPASMSELRTQAQRAIANNGPASRLRASTVSNFNRQAFRPSITQPSPYGKDHQNYGAAPEDDLAGAIEQLAVYDAPYASGSHLAGLYGPASLFKDVHRPRATTIGALDNPNRRATSRNTGALASIPQSPVQANMGYSSYNPYAYPRSRSDRDLTRSRDSSTSRGPRLSVSSHTSRTGTPDVAGSATPQMPTRSLWIGNLDVSATSDALLHVFAPYGAIESVRMLPEKTCAFVNFMEKADAMRARDDVLNRLGGHVTALSETAPVRIGFGKIDSAPTGPPTSSIAPAPPGLVFTNGTAVTVPPPVPAPGQQSSPDHNSEHSSLPTRALWIGSIPGATSSATLLQIFSPFGAVESARVLIHKCCGFVNFEHLDSAVAARNALNGRDILGSDIGPVRIGFARVPTRSPVLDGPDGEQTPKLGDLAPALDAVQGAAAVPTEQQISVEGGGVENYRSSLVLEMVKNGVHEQVLDRGLAPSGVVSEQQMIMQVLSGGRSEEDAHTRAAAEPRAPATYYTMIPNVHDRSMRRFDAPRLKELRRRLDAGDMRQEEIDAISHELMEDSAELSADYIGNTIIQKLFERTDPALRYAMLERIAPNLAMIGIHKNGTWAAQKIIECARTDAEKSLIASHLMPFAPPLMCDSLGNYVCAGTLRFSAPFNEYVFDAMMDRMWDIAQNRFGARCMRTCLESPHTSLYQKKRISAGIILNSIPLATNPNGALLLTWLVDQSNLPGRYGLLANRFAPHIAHLCTHKLASLTVLRIITQTNEPTASSTLITSIFTSSNDETLSDILSDANNGAQVVGKILAISTLSNDEKTKMVDAVRRVLPNIKASSTPPYRLLLEAVGLPVPAGGMGNSPFNQPQPQRNNSWHQPQIPQMGQQPGYYGHQAYGYAQPMAAPTAGAFGMSAMNLSPLLVPQNMPIGPAMRGGSPSLRGGRGSPRTPQPGRRDAGGQMMSPASDPFNPFASPSIDVPYMPVGGGLRGLSGLGQTSMTFEPQPNLGGLGIVGGSQATSGQQYYGGNMRQGMYAQGYQS